MAAAHDGGELILRGGLIVTRTEVLVRGAIRLADGVIRQVARPGELTPSPTAPRVIDVGNRWVVPGLIDLHVHGGGGGDATAGGEAGIRRLAAFHAWHGTTSLLATTVPVELGTLEAALGAIARVVGSPAEDSALVLGANLEGPFVSPARAGALAREHLLKPDPVALDRLLSAGRGKVRIATVAPELPGALELIERLRAAGVVASIGHTDASYDEAIAGVRAGARHATHVGNGMRGLDRREPGALGAVLDDDRVRCELICDGRHLDPAFVRIVQRVKGAGATVLVTDATAAAGMPEGTYPLGHAALSGRSQGRPPLAGSTLTMTQALRHAVSYLGVGLPEAIELAARTPASVLGLGDRKGVIAEGADADLLLLDRELSVAGVMVGGRWVRGPASSDADEPERPSVPGPSAV